MVKDRVIHKEVFSAFKRHWDFLTKVSDFYHAVKTGFLVADFTASHMSLLINLHSQGRLPKAPEEPEKVTFTNFKQVAADEESSGFAFANALFAVMAWTGLESLVEDVLLAVLKTEPNLLSREELQEIKVSVAEFYRLPEEDRLRLLVQELQKKLKVTSKLGVEQFESLLNLFGVAAQPDRDMRRTLFELAQVRNVIVHRAMVVDRRLTELCPWLGYKAGDPLRVRENQVDGYFRAVMDYGKRVSDRLFDVFGKDEGTEEPKGSPPIQT